ncbi:MAG: hypothetical protein U0821_15890 [Chloroflexota bacterium]
MPADSAQPLRRGLFWLAGASLLGIAAELAMSRHWSQPSQGIAWLALAGLAVAIVLGSRSASPRSTRTARLVCWLVLAAAIFGIWEHVYSNFDAAPLDQRYADAWDSLNPMTQWWLAATKGVGPSPPLAPAALAYASIIVLLVTTGPPRHQNP